MRVVIASGGTGGHFYPGFSLGKALRAKGHEVLFLVRKDDPALPLLEKNDLAALPLDVHGLPRRPSTKMFTFAVKFGGSLNALRKSFKSWKPDAVVGMGSYISYPAVLIAWWRGVPALIHESNSAFGLANRLSLNFVKTAALGLPMPPERKETHAVWKLTGTPVREALWERVDAGGARMGLGLERARKTVLVFGGSQGASMINSMAPGALAAASEAIKGGLQVLHLTGPKDHETVTRAYKELGVSAVVLPYLEGMELAFGAADLVVSRSGASSLAELVIQRKPAILIPFPHAAADHQAGNAKLLVKAGAAEMLLEAELTEETLGARVSGLLSQEDRLKAMQEAYAHLDIPSGKDSVEALVHAVEALTKKHK